MILHTINKTSSHESLNQQLSDTVDACDSVILIENGAYQAQQLTSTPVNHWSQTAKNIYVLERDALARGVSMSIDKINYIDYTKFVELSLLHDKVISWY